MLFNPPVTASWALKKLCYVKDRLGEWMGKPKYQIQEVYMHYLESSTRVRRDKFVWNRASLPRARFIL